VYADRYMEENRSDDIGCDVLRIFDVDPRKKWPQTASNIVLGPGQFMRMPFVGDDKIRPHLKDGESPITWFLTMGSVRQQKSVLLYEIMPFLMEQGAYSTEILWCPFPYDTEDQDFRQDCMEVIDGFEKMMEYNARYDTKFRMGLVKIWMPMGQSFDQERVYIGRMGAAVDMIAYYYVHSRVLSLGNFTTTDSDKRKGVTVDVENHGKRKFIAKQYLEPEGYSLGDYGLRTIRQRIRKLFHEEGVVPMDWMEAKDAGRIKAPGYWKPVKLVSTDLFYKYDYYEAPSGAPFNKTMLERARIRTEFSMGISDKNTLPTMIIFQFGMLNVGSATVDRMNISRMAKTRPGVGVKETVIPAGYESFPEMAMKRFDQERGKKLDEKRIIIPQDIKGSLLNRQVKSAPTKEEEIVRKELNRIQSALESPNSQAGAIRALHMVNAPAKKMAFISRLPQGVQSRLGARRTADTSLEFEEVEKTPVRGGEGGTTSHIVAQTTSKTSGKPLPILTDSAEESDNEMMDRIREQRYLVKMREDKLRMEEDKLKRMVKRHVNKRRQKEQ